MSSCFWNRFFETQEKEAEELRATNGPEKTEQNSNRIEIYINNNNNNNNSNDIIVLKSYNNTDLRARGS